MPASKGGWPIIPFEAVSNARYLSRQPASSLRSIRDSMKTAGALRKRAMLPPSRQAIPVDHRGRNLLHAHGSSLSAPFSFPISLRPDPHTDMASVIVKASQYSGILIKSIGC